MHNTTVAVLKVLKGKCGANKTFWLQRPAAKGVVLFFGGDQILDASVAPEIQHLQQSTTQAAIMAEKFPQQHIVVVEPSRSEACFACYDHFLDKITRSGEPLGYRGNSFKASSQITSLLKAGLPADHSTKLSFYLVGFSKGGVVLNQVLAEAAELWLQHAKAKQAGSLPTSEATQPMQGASHHTFLQNIREVHYLDVGLNCRGAHLTDPQVLGALSSFAQSLPQPLAISLHGTARQWEDKRRDFVRQEKDRFQRILQQAGLIVKQHQYFTGQEASLLMHFEVIRAMRRAGVEDL